MGVEKYSNKEKYLTIKYMPVFDITFRHEFKRTQLMAMAKIIECLLHISTVLYVFCGYLHVQ